MAVPTRRYRDHGERAPLVLSLRRPFQPLISLPCTSDTAPQTGRTTVPWYCKSRRGRVRRRLHLAVRLVDNLRWPSEYAAVSGCCRRRRRFSVVVVVVAAAAVSVALAVAPESTRTAWLAYVVRVASTTESGTGSKRSARAAACSREQSSRVLVIRV